MKIKKLLKRIIKKVKHKIVLIKKYIYNNFGPGFYLNKGAEMIQHNKSELAIQILEKGMKKFPSNEEILLELNRILTEKKEWKKLIELGNNFIRFNSYKIPSKVFIDLSRAYQKTDNLVEAEKILLKALKENNKDRKLLAAYVRVLIKTKNWSQVIIKFEKVLNKFKSKIPLNTCLYLSMVSQVIGNSDKATYYFDYAMKNYGDRMKNDKRGYRKIILFDNGESRIEFYKKLEKTNKVILTFDSINMVWKNPPFGYKLLSRQNLDIIAVRKRKKQTYHQDLTQEDFYNTVHNLVECYEDKIAYGFSLGAYTALYYSSIVDCRILAISPRISIHPIYGKKQVIPKYDFKHKLNLPYNERISPIIVYDPKNKLDNHYTNKEVLKAFPNAQLIKVPYGGHGMAPHLLQMGLLKEFVLTVISDNGLPVYNRKLKSKSSIYLRVLGRECFKRNKLKWTESLVEKSLSLNPKDIFGIQLKIDLLKRLEKYKDAISYLNEVIKSIPKNSSIRIMLIELYLETNELVKAEEEMNRFKAEFGGSTELTKLEKIIEEHRIN